MLEEVIERTRSVASLCNRSQKNGTDARHARRCTNASQVVVSRGHNAGRTLVPPAATATAAAAATAAVAATATAAAAPFFTRPGLVHGQGATIVLSRVEPVDGRLSFRFGAHFHEAEALAAARVAIHDHFGTLDRAEFRKQLVQV
jgi:hypothetical protein